MTRREKLERELRKIMPEDLATYTADHITDHLYEWTSLAAWLDSLPEDPCE